MSILKPILFPDRVTCGWHSLAKEQVFTFAVAGFPFFSLPYRIFFSSEWFSVIVIALSTFGNAEVTYFVHSLADSAVACRVS